MNQRVADDPDFDQHEAKPRFCEVLLSYRVMQKGKDKKGLRQKMERNGLRRASRFPE